MLRAAVVGARRNRQGTGEYVARELAAAGCAVTAIVGTRPESVEAARRGLRERHGLDVRGYTSLQALLEAETVDVVAICSPHAAHLPQLERALQAGCHVFAEKPLWWSDDLRADAIGPTVERLLAAVAPGRHLALNTQWPFTLDGFRALHPGAAEAPLERFDMWLSPNNPDPRSMVVDSGSHLLSMLQALAGPGTIVAPRSVLEDETLFLRCGYAHAAGEAQVELRLEPCPSVPRPAGYAINGAAVERRITLPEYRFRFEAPDGRGVDLDDPLRGCVRSFVTSAEAGRSPDKTRILAGMTQLYQLAEASTEEVVWPKN